MSNALDLVVLVADTDAEWTIRTLLEKRHAALRIRPLNSVIIRDPGRDAGVFQNAPITLRTYLNRVNHALVLLDYEGCGREPRMKAEQVEIALEQRLNEVGWRNTKVIVLDPELEVWVWSRSPHVAPILGLTPDILTSVLENFPKTNHGKPARPKAAMVAALRKSRRPHSPRIFQELAERVSLAGRERAFDRLRETLQNWFGIKE